MKNTNLWYWIFTGLFAFFMAGGAIPDVVSAQMAVDGFKQIDMPAYLLPFLGVAKICGIVAILIPGYPRLKEWAYAGLTFDLLGATYCIFSSHLPVGNWAFMAVPLASASGSYIFYHKRLEQKGVGAYA